MSGAKIDKLARMANQIGDAHASLPTDSGAAGVALHIKKFWTPKMIAETLSALDEGRVTLNDTSAAGFALLRKEFASAG